MEQRTTVWLVRHGIPDGVEGRCYGHYDAALSTEGERQSNHIAAQLRQEPLTRIYSSPLRRALDTARIVARGTHLQVEAVDDLCEMHFGDLEGLLYEEIQARYPAVFESWMTKPTETQFPNGENFQQMRQRVLATIEILITRHAGESIAVVTHSGVVRLLLAEALSIPGSEMFRLGQAYGAVNRIDYSTHGATVELINGVTR